MLQYPSITKNIIQTPIYAFDKLDGSNVRIEWSQKTGFSKFGSRTRLVSPDEEPLGEFISIFEKDFSEILSPILRKIRTPRATLFFEFYGENSFAGQHENETHHLSLFDVSIFKKGFMLPKEFMKTFANHVPTPNMVYYGNPNSQFISQVHDGELPGMTFEGVVCKSQELNKNKQTVFKVKNKEWLHKLKIHCGENNDLFEKLS